jgi:hypothetical protein
VAHTRPSQRALAANTSSSDTPGRLRRLGQGVNAAVGGAASSVGRAVRRPWLDKNGHGVVERVMAAVMVLLAVIMRVLRQSWDTAKSGVAHLVEHPARPAGGAGAAVRVERMEHPLPLPVRDVRHGTRVRGRRRMWMTHR